MCYYHTVSTISQKCCISAIVKHATFAVCVSISHMQHLVDMTTHTTNVFVCVTMAHIWNGTTPSWQAAAK